MVATSRSAAALAEGFTATHAAFVSATSECGSHDEARECPYRNGTDLASPVWIYCYSSLGATNRQVKPGVVAFAPGASIFFTLRPGFLTGRPTQVRASPSTLDPDPEPDPNPNPRARL